MAWNTQLGDRVLAGDRPTTTEQRIEDSVLDVGDAKHEASRGDTHTAGKRNQTVVADNGVMTVVARLAVEQWTEALVRLQLIIEDIRTLGHRTILPAVLRVIDQV